MGWEIAHCSLAPPPAPPPGPGDEMQPEEAEEILERYQQAMEALRPALEAWREAMLELWGKLCEALHPFIAALLDWWEKARREELYRRLRRRRVPDRLARFLARRWPERWLPELEK